MTSPDTGETAGARRRLGRLGPHRTVVILAVVAVVSLTVGFAASRFVVSPAQAATRAQAPSPGLITVPVERRTITNAVVLRGDAVFDDPLDLTVDTAEVDGQAVVTGRVPRVGDTVDAGSVVAEVRGRPVIALPGELTAYRTLHVGMSGPDVTQLKSGLRALGIDPGKSSTDYDAATATAVAALYTRVGYSAPEPTKAEADRLTAAVTGERQARQALAEAQTGLAKATQPLPASQRIALDNGVAAAQARLDEARSACAATLAASDPPCSQSAVAAAQGNLEEVVAARDEATAAPDVGPQTNAVQDASQVLQDAQKELATAKSDVLTALPVGEVAYVASLPRRVDAVAVALGRALDQRLMTVSGANLVVDVVAGKDDAALVTAGGAAQITLNGAAIDSTVLDVAPVAKTDPGAAAPSAAPTDAAVPDKTAPDKSTTQTDRASSPVTTGQYRIRVSPTGATPDQLNALRDANVKVTIPVSSSGGDVLAVPLAALTSGPSGEARVQVRGADGHVTVVEVEAGLAGDGYVQVTSEELHEGDLVVVGTQGTVGSAPTRAPATT